MASEKDIENIINMLDGKVAAGTSRINLKAPLVLDRFQDNN